MGIKFRWPIYRPFKITEEDKARLKDFMGEAENAAENISGAINTSPSLSPDDRKVIEEAIDGALGHMLRNDKDLWGKLESFAHMYMSEEHPLPSLPEEPPPPPPRVMKDSEDKPSNSKEELATPDDIIWKLMKDKMVHKLIQKGFSPFLAEDAVNKRSGEAICALHDVFKQTVPTPLHFGGSREKQFPISLTSLAEEILVFKETNKRLRKRLWCAERDIKTLLLRLEDVESQLEGTFFSKDKKNRPIDLLAEDVTDLEKMMEHVVLALEKISDFKQEPVNINDPKTDIVEVGKAFKAIIEFLENGNGQAEESHIKIVEPLIQCAFKICPDLEMHPPLTQARFLYGLCTQPMTVIRSIDAGTYFLKVEEKVAWEIASIVFGHKFLGSRTAIL